MDWKRDTGIIDYITGEGVLYVKHPENPVLDSVATNKLDVRRALDEVLGTERNDDIARFMKQPRPDVAMELAKDSEMYNRLMRMSLSWEHGALVADRRTELLEKEKTNPDVNFVATHVLPALSNLASRRYLIDALYVFASSLPWSETLNAWKIRAAMWTERTDLLKRVRGAPRAKISTQACFGAWISSTGGC